MTDAINFAPSNALKVELTDEDSDFPCIVADAQHRMTMSNNVFNLYGKTKRPLLLTVLKFARYIQVVVLLLW